jgi:sugar O-acyltransferase (sialic acid O-acetyltransferase NeuD family)
MKDLYVIGGGGHAKVIIGMCQALGRPVEAVLDDDSAKWGTSLLGVPVRGPVASMPAGACAVIAIGDNDRRRRLSGAAVEYATVVHPRAFVDPSASLGAGVVVFAGAIIQPDARVGAHSIINTAATVDHDCEIGPFVHVAPGVHLAGNVRVDEGAFLGIGSVVTPGRRIGAWSVVGAGGVVVKDIPERAIAMGVPARVIRERARERD